MHQIECFGCGFKAEYSRILVMQLTLKKIKLLEFYMQIEFIYEIDKHLFILLLIMTLYELHKGKEQNKQNERNKDKKNI